jgi:hypothetical protein
MEISQRPGVIDTISAGFGTVNKRLWLIIIPILLDLILWLGPKISIAPLVNRALDGYHRLLIESSAQIPSQEQVTLEQIEGVYRQTQEVVEPIGQVNLVGVLAWQLPSLMKTAMPENSAAMGVESGFMLVLLLLGLGLASLFGVCIYLGAIAQFVKGDHFDLGFFLRRIGLNWARLLLFFVLLLFPLGLLVPIGVFLLGVVGLGNVGVASLLGGLSLGVALWLMLYLFFVKSAIFVGDVSPLWAIWHSFNLVRHNLWSALGLFLLINIVTWGMAIAWGLIVGHPLGAVVAITGNAYVVTGLAAATMIYYRDRYDLLQPKVAKSA